MRTTIFQAGGIQAGETHSLGAGRVPDPKQERGASKMLRHTTVFLLLCALALSCAARQAAAQTRVPLINLKERTLANGLKVYSAQERSSPTVAIQVWYRVGSKDDPPSRSGFAHLFEHLMFKSSKNMKDEMMDRLSEDVGGWNNASTNDDVTNY
jgi:zinc protease